MEISNNQSYYINPNTRQFTSNVKNTAIKDREGLQWFDAESVKSHRGFGIGAQNAD